MKKLLFVLLAVLLLTGCAQKAPEPTEPATKTVYVHSTITRTSGEAVSHTEYIYDEAQQLTDVIVSDAAGQELQRYLVTCDENGNPVRWDTSVSGTASSVAYTYDARGRTLGTYAYTEDTLVTSTENTFSGDLHICVTIKSPAQGFEQRTEYTYDEKGSLTRQDQYVGGALTGYGLYTVGEEGKPLRCDNYTPEGELISAVTYAYDGTTETRTVTDQSGTLVTQIQTMTYDDRGNLLSSRVTDGSGQTLSSEVHTWMSIEVPADVPRAGV